MNHGHVTPNPDGSRARCGGPTLCPQCAKEAAAAALRQRLTPAQHSEQGRHRYVPTAPQAPLTLDDWLTARRAEALQAETDAVECGAAQGTAWVAIDYHRGYTDALRHLHLRLLEQQAPCLQAPVRPKETP